MEIQGTILIPGDTRNNTLKIQGTVLNTGDIRNSIEPWRYKEQY